MRRISLIGFFVFFSFLTAEATVMVGTGVSDLTPPIGTPSAGYGQRNGQGMVGTHDPLLATAIFIDNGYKQIALCGVDHLGFDYGMAQEIKRRIHENNQLSECEVYISSSHTHSGGGAYLDLPFIGQMLAGKFDPQIRKFYIDGAVRAILSARETTQPAKIGFGSGYLEGLSLYRSDYPKSITPPNRLHVIKITSMSDQPLCVLFNFALHPTTLGGSNYLFSADFVGVAREVLKDSLGSDVIPIFINGAQAELIPDTKECADEWQNCRHIGSALANSVMALWNSIEVNEDLEIETKTIPYAFEVIPTPAGLKLPLDSYESEISLLLFNKKHLFLAVPGELSCVYDHMISQYAEDLGYKDLAIFGLTNDAHGYIIIPQAWEHGTKESHLSFGGKFYGESVFMMMQQLLDENKNTR